MALLLKRCSTKEAMFKNIYSAAVKRSVSTQSMSPAIFQKYMQYKEKALALAPTPLKDRSQSGVEEFKDVKSAQLSEAPSRELLKKPEITLRSNFSAGSPQKLNEVGRQIYRLSLEEAMLQMKFSPKRPARRVLSLLELIKAKAQRENIRTDNMVIERVTVGRGQIIRKIDIKGRGRTGIRKKTFSHVRITLKEPNYATIYRHRYRWIVPKEHKPVYFSLDY